MTQRHPPTFYCLKNFYIEKEFDDCAFYRGDFVLVKEEYNSYKSSNRASETPVYRINYLEDDQDLHYDLWNMQTNAGNHSYAHDELLPVEQKIPDGYEDNDGDNDGMAIRRHNTA